MNVNEVAPPEWGHTKAEKEKTKPNKPKSKIGGTAAAFKRALDDGRFKGLPGDKTKKEKTASMFKLMWSMKKKGAKPHYKPGTDKKYKKYQEEETNYNQRDKELKKTKKAMDYRHKTIHKGGDDDINESDFRSYMAQAQAARDRLKKKIEDRKKKDAQFVDTKTKGVKFYDKKGSGRIKSGKKIYDK